VEFGERVRALRLARGMTQDDLALAVGVSPSGGMVRLWEHGRKKPGYLNLRDLCLALNTSADYLLGFTDDPNPRLAVVNSRGAEIRATGFLAAAAENEAGRKKHPEVRSSRRPRNPPG
jgi:transcriptional regulator with XRE-family HTH domain